MNEGYAILITSSVISTLVSIVLLLGFLGAKRELKRMDSIEKKVDDVKTNYLNRFDEVKDLINDVKVTLAEKR